MSVMNRYEGLNAMIRKAFSMPDELGEHIDQRVKSGGYGNESEFIRELVRKDRDRQSAIGTFEKLIDEGLASGTSPRTVEEMFADAMKRYEQRKKRA